MAYQYQTLSREKTEVIIQLKTEKLYFKLLGIYSNDINAEELSYLQLNLMFQSNHNSHSFEEQISIGGGGIKTTGHQKYLSINYTPSIKLGGVVNLFIKEFPSAINELILIYDIDDLCIEVSDPFNAFVTHLDDSLNPRILFSAPFGHGKTTFLKLFFDNKKETYEVFHIYPVNFSVAKTEDIFRYIKTELLFQLLGRNIEFEKVDINKIWSVTGFLGKNIHRIFAPFIHLIPLIGGSLNSIYQELYALSNEYRKASEIEQKNDEELARLFIEEVYNQEGSIFEDNFYTQLIRQLIDQLKDNGKQVVLVIDDLDRMDPDHIFRILNVFSAHADDYSSQGIGSSNKFGFDKTIIVADYSNLIGIFKHKYGAETDSSGYFDKFFSKNIFHYNNTDAMHFLIDEYTQYRGFQYDEMAAPILLRITLRMLLKTNNISLRELLHLRSLGNSYLKLGFGNNKVYFPFIVLNQIFTNNELELKLKKANEKFDQTPDYLISDDYYVWMILLPFSENIESSDARRLLFKNKEYVFRINSDNIERKSVVKESVTVNNIKPNRPDKLFNSKDFSDAILMLYRKYLENKVAIENDSIKKYVN